MNYNIRKTGYFTEITPKNPDVERLREMIRKRKATRWLTCYECNEPIPKNAYYIRDKFWYASYNYYLEENTIKTKVNFICLTCWKGDIPSLPSTNWKR